MTCLKSLSYAISSASLPVKAVDCLDKFDPRVDADYLAVLVLIVFAFVALAFLVVGIAVSANNL